MVEGATDLEAIILEALSRSRAGIAENMRQRAERMSQVIFGCFRDAIETGRLQPKDRLPAERQVMRMFETSRGPVRKAMKILEDTGMVTRHVGSGTYVAEPPVRAVAETVAGAIPVSPQDIIEARFAIEPGFAEFVVARATTEDFGRMESWLTRAEQAPDQRHFREAMYNFHLEVARATRNPLLATIFEVIIAVRARAGWEKLPHINETRASQRIITDSSRRIMAAFRNRESAAARQLLREHFSRLVIEVVNLPFNER